MIASIPGLTNVFTLKIQRNVYGFIFLPFSSGKRITNIKNNLKNTIQLNFFIENERPRISLNEYKKKCLLSLLVQDKKPEF